MLAGKDLRRGKDMGVDEGLIDSQECLVSACADPRCLASVFGADVGHGGRFGIPVGHVENRSPQLSFLRDNDVRIFNVLQL